MFLIDILASSENLDATLVNSNLLSSVKSGNGTLINWPSVLGFNPSSDSRIAYSIFWTIDLSQTWTVNSLGSGAFTVASSEIFIFEL